MTKNATIAEGFRVNETGATERTFHVWIGRRHRTELCGTNYLEVKKRLVTDGMNVRFKRAKPLDCIF
jgi:hypothetical protein